MNIDQSKRRKHWNTYTKLLRLLCSRRHVSWMQLHTFSLAHSIPVSLYPTFPSYHGHCSVRMTKWTCTTVLQSECPSRQALMISVSISIYQILLPILLFSTVRHYLFPTPRHPTHPSLSPVWAELTVAANLVRNYSPHLPPSTREAPAAQEIHKILREEAIVMIKSVLQGFKGQGKFKQQEVIMRFCIWVT
jgi:hypothetical protein